MINDSEKNNLKLARKLSSKVDELHQRIDSLLDPIVNKAIAEGPDACNALLNELPQGFHRTELRAFLIRSEKKSNKLK